MLATPAYFERHGMPQAPADLPAHRAVVYTRDLGGGEDWTFRREAAELPVRLQGRVRISATEGADMKLPWTT